MAATSSSPDVPPFVGYVESTVNALRLIHAARQGVIPRITRRLNDAERRTMIKSGAVFVFSVDESTIKRWTDGLLWSPSRIVGNFLVYREINERASSRSGSKKPYPLDSPGALVRTGMTTGHSPPHSPNDQGTFKPNGLIKKTITVTVENADLHLVSYYTMEDIRSGKLKRPSCRADIMSLPMPPHMFQLTNFRVPPKTEIGPDGKHRFVTEPEDAEPNIEPKVEETTYHLSHSPHSPSTPTSPDHAFSGAGYSGMNHESSYHRNADRWSSGGNDISRVASPTRQDYSWTLSPISTHPSLPTSKRETLSEATWTSVPSNRYDSSSASVYDHSRTRMRPYHSAAPRDADGGYGSRPRHREGSAHRLPWLLNDTQTSTVDREARGTSCRSSYTPTTTSISNTYSSTGVAYSSAYGPPWGGASDHSSLVSTPPPFNHGYSSAPFASQGHGGYDS